MARAEGCQGQPLARGMRRRLWRETRECASGLISAISRGLNGRTLWTNRGNRIVRIVEDSHPRSRNAARIQHPRVRRAAFTRLVYRKPAPRECMIVFMRAADVILEEALKLPEEERARVALRLSESLSSRPDDRTHEAWAGEITRRIARLNDGTARTVTADEALSRARARLATHRA